MNVTFPCSVAQTGGNDNIFVTASRTPVDYVDSVASTMHFGEDALDVLSLPAVPDLLRLSPGVGIATTGPRGTQTQVRIRGAEAGHTLVFLDGIRFNDPAAGNEARFELLTADALSRLEIVRGPQSALWGSEALGGVIAAETADAFRGAGFEGRGEYGSLDSARFTGRHALRTGDVGIALGGGCGATGSTPSVRAASGRIRQSRASLKVEARPSTAIRFGVTGHYFEAESDFDGSSGHFRRADTRIRPKTDRGGARLGEGTLGGWTVSAMPPISTAQTAISWPGGRTRPWRRLALGRRSRARSAAIA